MAGDHDHRYIRIDLCRLLQEFQPVNLRHLDVAKHRIISLIPELLQPVFPVTGLIHLVPLVCEYLRQRLAYGSFIVNDQDVRHVK